MMQLLKRGLATILCAAVLICGCCMPKSPIYVQADAVGPAAFAGAALSAFVTACGINFNFTGANASTAADAVMGLWDEFSSSTGAGALGVISEGKLSISSLGKIIIAPALVATFRSFVDWLQGDKGLTEGGSVSFGSSAGNMRLADGTFVPILQLPSNSVLQFPPLTSPSDSYSIIFSDKFYINVLFSNNRVKSTIYADGQLYSSYTTVYNSVSSVSSFGFYFNTSGVLRFGLTAPLDDGSLRYVSMSPDDFSSVFADFFVVGGSYGLSADAIDVPGEGIADDQAVVVDVGAAAGITADELTDAINAALAAGTATATATVETVAAGEVVPVPEVEGLGLPSLGAALTSRFPFSIPWDVAAIVGLLSAEPQAPYWSVDLMQPLRARGVHFNGSTTIEIDLRGEQWAVIGQVCRWGTLITFCLGLAFATKRLIWSA